MGIDTNSVASEAIDYYGNPGAAPSTSWWDMVKAWIKEYLEPLVPAANLANYVAQVLVAIKKLLGFDK